LSDSKNQTGAEVTKKRTRSKAAASSEETASPATPKENTTEITPSITKESTVTPHASAVPTPIEGQTGSAEPASNPDKSMANGEAPQQQQPRRHEGGYKKFDNKRGGGYNKYQNNNQRREYRNDRQDRNGGDRDRYYNRNNNPQPMNDDHHHHPSGDDAHSSAANADVDISDIQLTDEEKSWLSSKDLKSKSITQLTELALKLKIENAAGLRRQDMIFEILKRAARLGTDIYGSGVLEILPDGYGFLRSPDYNYLPGPDDIYVSPSQIRRFGLRTGDTVTGTVRPPKDGER